MTQSNWVYGIVGADGGFIHTANTEKGAKRKATNDGYLEVYKMHQVSWSVCKVAEKIGNTWIPCIN